MRINRKISRRAIVASAFAFTIVLTLLVGYIFSQMPAASENTLEIWAKESLLHEQKLPPPIALNAQVSYENNGPILSFKLTNISNNNISIPDAALPWAHAGNIKVAAFSANGQRLSNIYLIDDPIPERDIVILPGKSLEGKYRLLDAINFDSRSSQENRIILWSYRMWWIGPKNFPERSPILTGAVVIPARMEK